MRNFLIAGMLTAVALAPQGVWAKPISDATAAAVCNRFGGTWVFNPNGRADCYVRADHQTYVRCIYYGPAPATEFIRRPVKLSYCHSLKRIVSGSSSTNLGVAVSQ
jgi:hypothetical protein